MQVRDLRQPFAQLSRQLPARTDAGLVNQPNNQHQHAWRSGAQIGDSRSSPCYTCKTCVTYTSDGMALEGRDVPRAKQGAEWARGTVEVVCSWS